MTLSPAPDCPISGSERRATLARVYAYLIEQGRLRKKQNAQPVADSQVTDLPASPQQDEQACSNA